MKKGLIALAIAAVSGMRRPEISEFQITPTPAYQVRQHSSVRTGKSGVAAAKRAARKRKAQKMTR